MPECCKRARFLTRDSYIVSVETGAAPGCVHRSYRPRRLARPRTPPFHGDNMGSNPIGDAIYFQGLTKIAFKNVRLVCIHYRDSSSSSALLPMAIRTIEINVTPLQSQEFANSQPVDTPISTIVRTATGTFRVAPGFERHSQQLGCVNASRSDGRECSLIEF